MNDQTEIVKEHFEERSTTYADMFDPNVRTGTAFRFQRRRRIVRELAAAQSGRLVDCATGTGEVTLAALETQNFDTACINDVSPEMLARSSTLIQDSADAEDCSCTFVTGDVFDLNSQPAAGSYDLVVCVGLLAHVGRLEELMQLCESLVSDEGHVLLQTTLLDHPGVRITRMMSERRHVRQKGYAIRHYKHAQILKAAAATNLEVIERRCFGLDVPFLDKVAPRLSHFSGAAVRIPISAVRIGSHLRTQKTI